MQVVTTATGAQRHRGPAQRSNHESNAVIQLPWRPPPDPFSSKHQSPEKLHPAETTIHLPSLKTKGQVPQASAPTVSSSLCSTCCSTKCRDKAPCTASPGVLEGRWFMLFVLSVCTVFGLCAWFAASAVLPALTAKWQIDQTDASLLTIAVNIGFFVGSLISFGVNLPDRVRPTNLVAVGCILSALFNAGLLIPDVQFGVATSLRFLTGASMTLVYPMACEVACTWFTKQRGLSLSVILASLVLGSAVPHLINAAVQLEWQILVLACSTLNIIAAGVTLLALSEGPGYSQGQGVEESAIGSQSTTSLSPVVKQVLGDARVWYAMLAYSGHNYELYAVWSWFGLYTVEQNVHLDLFADDQQNASFSAFVLISVGMVGCLAAGLLSDRFGRVPVCIASLAISSTVSLCIGLVTSPAAAMALALVWGVAVISDSAQYSAIVSELVPSNVVGTAITIQFGFGYLFTVPAMYLVPWVEDQLGWAWAWRLLSVGPLLGVVALVKLSAVMRQEAQ